MTADPQTTPAPKAKEDVVVARDTMFVEQNLRFDPTARWLRAYVDGVAVGDSKRAVLLIENKRLPVYLFPVEDVRADLIRSVGKTQQTPNKGTLDYFTLTVGDRVIERAGWTYSDVPPDGPPLDRYVAFYWNRMDRWFEEDDEVYVHARDPYHRVDTLHSSRAVSIELMGETVAESVRPRLLFETGLPARYYLPKLDVRMDMLVKSDTVTQCPYKGVATHWGVRVGDRIVKDVAWSYEYPVPECPKIEGLICFYNERVDATHVDGEIVEFPSTPWSRNRVIVKAE